jgi:hypothetical protein
MNDQRTADLAILAASAVIAGSADASTAPASLDQNTLLIRRQALRLRPTSSGLALHGFPPCPCVCERRRFTVSRYPSPWDRRRLPDARGYCLPTVVFTAQSLLILMRIVGTGMADQLKTSINCASQPYPGGTPYVRGNPTVAVLPGTLNVSSRLVDGRSPPQAETALNGFQRV